MVLRTNLTVYISCEPADIVNANAFERAAEFAAYEADIEIRCSDGKYLLTKCSQNGPICWGWRYFRDLWIRKYGPI